MIHCLYFYLLFLKCLHTIGTTTSDLMTAVQQKKVINTNFNVNMTTLFRCNNQTCVMFLCVIDGVFMGANLILLNV